MTERPHEMRDPIHGFIKLSEKEKRLIDTQVFQRLRRIRQLAMTFLVYPGAQHTRFDHSIGVMHIAGRICKRLQELDHIEICETTVDRIRFTALLHDVGHGPFSHVSEHLLDENAPDKDQVREKIHEKITVDIIRTDSEINEILSSDERDFVISMIEEQGTWNWQRDIVSSELDADKMDYLLRDSYFAGVKYGLYDLEKLIEAFFISENSVTPLAIKSTAIYALEQLLLARYHMTQQVYWHRVSLISNEMIIRGITLAIDGNNPEMTKLYRYPEKNNEESDQNYEQRKKGFIQNYLDYYDEKVIDILKNDPDEEVPAETKEIFGQLYNRKLFKMISELRFKDERDVLLHSRLNAMLGNKQQKRQCEAEIAEHLGLNPAYVIVSKPPIRTQNYGIPTNLLNPEAIMIFDEDENGLRRMIDYANELFFVRPSTDVSSLETVQVYAPDQVSETQKREIQEILRRV